jgi:hypothetical protein
MGLVTHHAHAARAGAAKMPPTPRQTESLEPRILGGGWSRIWRMLPGKRTCGNVERTVVLGIEAARRWAVIALDSETACFAARLD